MVNNAVDRRFSDLGDVLMWPSIVLFEDITNGRSTTFGNMDEYKAVSFVEYHISVYFN